MSDLPPPEGFDRPDPNAMTQRLSVVRPAAAEVADVPSYRPPPAPAPAVVPGPPIAKQKKPKADKAPYAPIFGNIGAYAFTRFVALAIDFGIVPTFFACFLFNLADRGTLAFAPRTLGGFVSIALLAFAAAFVFAILFESIFETTMGKALFGLGVRRGTGQHAGPQRIFVRYLLLPIDLLVIGEILALVTRRHQRIGDFAAGTVVARHRSGGFITAFALILFAGLIYAQATTGGGFGSALVVTTEASYYIPTIVGGALANLGLVSRPGVPPPLLAPSAEPQASIAPLETTVPTEAPTATDAPEATAAPTAATE